MSDWIEQLERLTQLHKNGALSDDEYSVQKAKILGHARNVGSTDLQQPYPVKERSTFTASNWAVGGLSVAVIGLLIWVFTFSGLKQNEHSELARGAAGPTIVVSSPIATSQPIIAQTPAQINSPAEPVLITYNPSFRCNQNQDRDLNIICHNRELSEKDRQLSKMFKIIMAEIPIEDRQQFLSNQRRLLANRSVCSDVYCVSNWYDKTIAFYTPAFGGNNQ